MTGSAEPTVTVTRADLERAFRLVAHGNANEHLTFEQWATALFGALVGEVVTREAAAFVDDDSDIGRWFKQHGRPA